MDPNILTTTAAVVGQTALSTRTVSDELQVFLNNAKSTEEAARSLQREVKSFGDSCDALQSLLNGLATSKTNLLEPQDAQLYTKVQQAMSEYAGTIGSLGQHVRNLDNNRSSIRRPSWMGAKLGAKSDEFTRARQRIDAHLLSLQMIMSILNLCVPIETKRMSLQSARVADKYSRLSLQSLEIVDPNILKSGIHELQRNRARLQATSQVNSPYLGQDEKLFNTTAALIAEADLILTLAFSTYEDSMSARSITSASRAGTMTDQTPPSRNAFGTPPLVTPPSVIEANVHPAYRNSSFQIPPAGSPLVPEPLALHTSHTPVIPEHREQGLTEAPEDIGSRRITPSMARPLSSVSTWIQGLSELDKRQRSSTLASRQLASNRTASTADSAEGVSTRSIGERMNSDTTSLTQPSISQSPQSVGDFSKTDGARQLNTALALMDDSDDDDIEVELARNVLAIGKTALDEEDYAKARGCLLEGLSLVQRLPSRLQPAACDMLELRYQLATCALALDNQVAIEKALVEVLQQEPESDAQREKLFHISHILAQLYIRTARLGLARQTCTNALRGRRKLFGKEYDGYYSSLGLIARICVLENAHVQAQGYINMIPAEERSKYTFQHIKIEEHCEKEVVIAEMEAPLQSPGPSVQSPTASVQTPVVSLPLPTRVRDTSCMSPLSAVESRRQSSARSDSFVDTSIAAVVPINRETNRKPFRTQPPVYAQTTTLSSVQPLSRYTTQIQTTEPTSYRPSPSLGSGRGPVSPIVSPSVDSQQNFIDVPTPSPKNGYLGYCKGAWMLQTGDAKAMKKSKEFSMTSHTTYSLNCTASKCAFGTEIELSVIGTWAQIHRTKERIGIAYRWAFLAKSHVQQQIKVSAHQTLYKCLFCIAQGATAPVMQGTDLYLAHISQEHRGKKLGVVVLHQTRCIDDRVCTDKDEFDINIYPVAG